MKKVLKWTAIVVGVVYSLIVFVAPAVLLHLLCDKHVAYHRVYKAEEAVTEYVKATYADIPVIVMGLSMGGSIAIRSIGKNDDIDALITLSAYSSVQDFMGGQFGRFITPVLAYPVKLTTALYAGLKFGVNGFNATPLESIGNLHGRPALMMHSRKDSQVPFICFEKLTQKATTVSNDIRTYIVDGDEHFITGSFGMPEEDKAYNSVLLEFVKSVVDK